MPFITQFQIDRQAFIVRLDVIEQEARSLGMFETMHAINKAKNTAGTELAYLLEQRENPNHDLQKRRRGRKVQFSWGDVYNRHVAKGEDHASAAYAADEADKRAKRTT